MTARRATALPVTPANAWATVAFFRRQEPGVADIRSISGATEGAADGASAPSPARQEDSRPSRPPRPAPSTQFMHRRPVPALCTPRPSPTIFPVHPPARRSMLRLTPVPPGGKGDDPASPSPPDKVE